MAELSKKQKIFIENYIKTSDGLASLIKAYPSAEKWTYNAKHVQVNKLLNNPKINLILAKHNKKTEQALINSTTLNKRKILNEIIDLTERLKEAGIGQSNTQLQALKLLSQIAGLLQDNNNNIQVNVQNNTIMGAVTDYLNL